MICGSVGPAIARRVRDGNGQAEVDIADIRLAVETHDSAEALLDNFMLTDPKTRRPLLLHLLDFYIGNSGGTRPATPRYP